MRLLLVLLLLLLLREYGGWKKENGKIGRDTVVGAGLGNEDVNDWG